MFLKFLNSGRFELLIAIDEMTEQAAVLSLRQVFFILLKCKQKTFKIRHTLSTI